MAKTNYIVYGKIDVSTRNFKPMDMENNIFVNRLMYASLFTKDELEELKKEVEYMNKNNPNYTFEIRKK